MPTVTEVKFIEYARLHRVDRYLVDMRHVTAIDARDWVAEDRVVAWSGVITPRGLDLLDTAEAIGFDPAETVAAQAEPPCSTCGGEREIPVIGDFRNPCPDCAEAGRADISEAKGRAAEAVESDVGCETIDDIERRPKSWVGRRVQIIDQ